LLEHIELVVDSIESSDFFNGIVSPAGRFNDKLGATSFVSKRHCGMTLIGTIQDHLLLIRHHGTVAVNVTKNLKSDAAWFIIANSSSFLSEFNNLLFNNSAIFEVYLCDSAIDICGSHNISQEFALFASS